MGPRSGQPRRRSLTAQYKADILTEYDAADPAARGWTYLVVSPKP